MDRCLATTTTPKNRIRDLRTARGWTQRDLAARAGLEVAMMARIDGNPLAEPSLPTALKLADALGVPIIELIEEPVPT